ncbi:DUF4136 domain-containing protein [Mucilaginibacter auburnensis]|uniref:Uncharacterized protein DUF4136 n=1 Tax=Mucilaginibacter auburnensis TaxID=1457233 RepID=A0A2H9VTY6_9SPHI|nr:DUF4136 domain-containing protein [Mucilaginibacter auburnensis]PJJ84275.1 uncharacterized protein DUF4136 [Mucilaginibacter auburnensis]
MKKLIVFVLSVVTLSSCSTRYNYYVAALNRTNLSAYRTFSWMQPPGGAAQPSISVTDAKIKDAAAQALTQKGLTMQQQNPDLLVSYSKVEGRGSRTNYYPMYVGGGFYPGFGWGWGGLGWGGFGWGGFGYGGWYNPYFYGPSYYAGTTVQREHFKEGTLVIDLIDNRSKQLVWRGYGVGEVRNNQQKDIEDLPKVVSGIFEQLSLAPSSAPPAGGSGRGYRTSSSR